MKVSTKGRYGLRVMIELAARYGNGPVMMDTISNCVGVSRKYLYNLLTTLKTAGLVRAVRGAGGGFELTRKPADMTANEVVQTLEGPLTLVHCIEEGRSCERIESCASREVWLEMGNALDKVLSAFTLEQLAERQHAKSSEPLMYNI
jgi:Rrf2 family protein